MKVSQNDLIISIVAVVLGLGISAGCFFMQRKPVQPPAPTPVNLTKASLPAGTVSMASSLPAGGGGAGGGAGSMAGFGGPSMSGKPRGGIGAGGMGGGGGANTGVTSTPQLGGVQGAG